MFLATQSAPLACSLEFFISRGEYLVYRGKKLLRRTRITLLDLLEDSGHVGYGNQGTDCA
ncbi:hypothetical protein CKO51_19275 [Rhodopirellula sp. SM50]|nr:hypothetical protein CKO51_19275 [Rhodopirellula sp. SM50]